MYKEKELREYLKSKTKEEIIDLYIQETFETNFMIEDLQKDIEHLTDATNYYYDENDKFKRQLEEKDKRIRNLNLEAQKYYEDAYCNNFQTKAKINFAIEQLEKVREIIDKNYFYNMSSGCCTFDKLEVDFQINNQIKELKGRKSMKNNYNDFFINGVAVMSWDYDNYKNELKFFTGSFLIATISYSKKEFDILNKMTEIDQWNNLAELFGD